jgi:hypothetical protein
VTDCPFCRRIASDDVTESNARAVAFADAYPVAAGHTLVVPRRHVASVFDLAGAASRSRRALRRGDGGARRSDGTHGARLRAGVPAPRTPRA